MDFYSRKLKNDGTPKKLGGGARSLREIKLAGGMDEIKTMAFRAGEESMAGRLFSRLEEMDSRLKRIESGENNFETENLEINIYDNKSPLS